MVSAVGLGAVAAKLLLSAIDPRPVQTAKQNRCNLTILEYISQPKNTKKVFIKV